MQGIILAAGTGSRLGKLTAMLPKALITIAGRPLLSYSIAFAKQAGCNELIVVTGAFAEKTQKYLENLAVPKLSWVENKDYLKGNLYSLGAALPRIKNDFLLMNTDHIYRSKIASKVRHQCSGLKAFCDHDRKLGHDDMKIKTDSSGNLGEISKKLSTYDAGYVGMTFCSAKYLDIYLNAFKQISQKVGDQAVVEMVLAEMALMGTPPGLADIGGVGWLEIDTPEERLNAEKEVMSLQDAFPILEA